MKSPITGKPMRIHKEIRTMSFRKEEFNIFFHSYECIDAHQKFESEDFAELNYNQLVNQFREKYQITFPEEIKKIREKYQISAAKMADILGFGTNNYRHYEVGEVPSQSNANLIRLISDPREFKTLVLQRVFSNKQTKVKLLKNIDLLIDEIRKDKYKAYLREYFIGNHFANALSGYKKPDFVKFSEMVVFFAEKLEPWKTKMNKLLFYADFLNYKLYGYSISGTEYKAISMGPVPTNFGTIFDYLANNDDLDIYYTTFPDGYVGEQFKPFSTRSFNSNLFSEKELAVLDEVAQKFKDTSTREMINLSHMEKAWIDNEAERKIIDYSYAFELSQV